jgi:hypothetical protein
METKTPHDWLMQQFEEIFDYRKETGDLAEVGVAAARQMVELIDDLSDHSFPWCSVCGWLGEGEFPQLLSLSWLTFPTYTPFRVSRIRPSRYLQQGLPPV